MRRFSLFSSSRAGTLLLILDISALLVIFAMVHLFHLGYPLDFMSPQLYGIIALTCLTLYMLNIYRIDYNFPSFTFPALGVVAVMVAGLVLAAIFYSLPEQSRVSSSYSIFWRGVLIVSLTIFSVWVAMSRFLVSAIYNRLSSVQHWLVIGNPNTTDEISNDLKRIRAGETLIEVPIDALESKPISGDDQQGGTTLLEFVPDSRKLAGIVIAQKDNLSVTLINALLEARLAGIRIYDIIDFYETFLLKVPVRFMHDQWLVMAQGFSIVYHNIQLRLKKLIDLLIAAALLIVTFPLMVLIAIVVRVDSKGDAFYAQERVGLNGKVFKIYKFRTMSIDAEEHGARWADQVDDRITRMGKILRPSRLDELPQLWNVLIGEMSFVGPRPERPAFTHDLEQKIPYFNLRVLVKPGITGWAQVQYPYGSSVEDARQKLEYDLFYIKNYSILLDLAILFKTMRVVLFRSGR